MSFFSSSAKRAEDPVDDTDGVDTEDGDVEVEVEEEDPFGIEELRSETAGTEEKEGEGGEEGRKKEEVVS